MTSIQVTIILSYNMHKYMIMKEGISLSINSQGYDQKKNEWMNDTK